MRETSRNLVDDSETGRTEAARRGTVVRYEPFPGRQPDKGQADTGGSSTLRDEKTGLYSEEFFNRLLDTEMRRCERSKEPIVLMLADVSYFPEKAEKTILIRDIREILSTLTRDTDIKGWYVQDSVVGVLFTEIANIDDNFMSKAHQIINKCSRQLSVRLGADAYSQLDITWQVFPEEFSSIIESSDLEEERMRLVGPKIRSMSASSLFVKRFFDIVGSTFGIALTAPVMVILAILIKVSSRGPVLFRQERIGQGGKTFSFLKFRSMYTDNDPTIHREYVKNLITGATSNNGDCQPGRNGAFKIQNDPRVTPIGRILRRMSLDELPQFFNVLKGNMSLVGPRPPLRYECEDYEPWHRHRVLDMKPGITGLWQVTGRSSTSFDEMVRLDIKYIREWSIWLDLRIIFRTASVVISGTGAY
jgi:lipopolysaccharide/colanic/teichoic acid biosynthesis glycosyltransferase